MSMYSRYPKLLAQRVASSPLAPRQGGMENAHEKCGPAMPFIRNKIARHEANTRGRDFIVGDLHGCVDYLNTLMRHAGFDPSSDRLFSVGDLVDRGPDSPGALELLEQPSFYPVMGNHDAMLLAVLMQQDESVRDLSEVDQVRAEIYAEAFFWQWRKMADDLFA